MVTYTAYGTHQALVGDLALSCSWVSLVVLSSAFLRQLWPSRLKPRAKRHRFKSAHLFEWFDTRFAPCVLQDQKQPKSASADLKEGSMSVSCLRMMGQQSRCCPADGFASLQRTTIRIHPYQVASARATCSKEATSRQCRNKWRTTLCIMS